MIKASRQKQKETEMVQTRILYRKEDDKKNQPGDSSHATNTLGSCSEGTSYEYGCSSLPINMFSDILPSVALPHTRGICLLGSTGESWDLPLEAHQALVIEISSEKRDVPLKRDSMVPFLQSSKCQPDESLE